MQAASPENKILLETWRRALLLKGVNHHESKSLQHQLPVVFSGKPLVWTPVGRDLAPLSGSPSVSSSGKFTEALTLCLVLYWHFPLAVSGALCGSRSLLIRCPHAAIYVFLHCPPQKRFRVVCNKDQKMTRLGLWWTTRHRDLQS